MLGLIQAEIKHCDTCMSDQEAVACINTCVTLSGICEGNCDHRCQPDINKEHFPHRDIPTALLYQVLSTVGVQCKNTFSEFIRVDKPESTL